MSTDRKFIFHSCLFLFFPETMDQMQAAMGQHLLQAAEAMEQQVG